MEPSDFSSYTIRYRLDRWWLYRNATPLEAFATGARALKALREIQGAAIVPDHILGEIAP